MPEVSEREIKERKERKERKENENEMVVFRVTPLQKSRLRELADFYNVTMTEVLVKSINVAWKNKEKRREIEEEAERQRQELANKLDKIDGNDINIELGEG